MNNSDRIQRELRGVEGMKFNELEYALIEGNQVARILNANKFVGANASEWNLYKLSNPKVLHIATHGFFIQEKRTNKQEILQLNPDAIATTTDPMSRSGVVLAGANQATELAKSGYDGFATALEISEMNLAGTDLVVLSACDTGKGDLTSSEGVFGLRRAVKFAGAKSLIMSLIKVPDNSTQKLMERFYSNYTKGKGKHNSLRLAQISLLSNPQTKHPIHWAGFVLIGQR